MKMAKCLMLIGIGMGSVLLYQKYEKPIKKEIDKKLRKTDKMLDEML